MTDDFPLIWYWRKRLGHRKGQPCRILARSKQIRDEATNEIVFAANSVLVEFDDGFQVVTSGWAVRRRDKLPGDDCSLDSCDGDFHSHGYCSKHASRFRRWGSPHYRAKKPNGYWDGVECDVPGCRKAVKGHGYCSGHLKRLERTGGLGDFWGWRLLHEPLRPDLEPAPDVGA